jgi:hypothetical protein
VNINALFRGSPCHKPRSDLKLLVCTAHAECHRRLRDGEHVHFDALFYYPLLGQLAIIALIEDLVQMTSQEKLALFGML